MRFSNDPKLELRRTFRKPPSGKVRKGSLLVLLRSDLQAAYGPEGEVGGNITSPLLVALGICAGLELLTKYWSGKTATGQADVLSFLRTVAGLPKGEAEPLIQFRNALAHGYGLATRRKKDDKLFMFALDPDTVGAPSVLSPDSPDLYVVHLWSLKRFFLEAIPRCRRAIAADWQRMGGFQVCIRNLREIRIGKSV